MEREKGHKCPPGQLQYEHFRNTHTNSLSCPQGILFRTKDQVKAKSSRQGVSVLYTAASSRREFQHEISSSLA